MNSEPLNEQAGGEAGDTGRGGSEMDRVVEAQSGDSTPASQVIKDRALTPFQRATFFVANHTSMYGIRRQNLVDALTQAFVEAQSSMPEERQSQHEATPSPASVAPAETDREREIERCAALDCGHEIHWGERCPDCCCIGIPPGAPQDGPWAASIAALPPDLRKLADTEDYRQNCDRIADDIRALLRPDAVPQTPEEEKG